MRSNFDSFWLHKMIVRNDRLKWPFDETLKWSFAEMLIGCFISEVVFRWDCICCVRYGDDFWLNADDWCLFLRKLDQMNVYEDRSTVLDDVEKWSNECDAAIELWAGKLLILMSEMLHLTVIRSDALTVLFVKLPKLHLMSMSSDALAVDSMSDDCIRFRAIKCTGEIVCWCQMTAFDLERSDALAKLSDCQTIAFDANFIKCFGDCLIARYQAEKQAGYWLIETRAILISKKKTVVVAIARLVYAVVRFVVRSFFISSHTSIIRTKRILLVDSIVVFFLTITELVLLLSMYSEMSWLLTYLLIALKLRVFVTWSGVLRFQFCWHENEFLWNHEILLWNIFIIFNSWSCWSQFFFSRVWFEKWPPRYRKSW